MVECGLSVCCLPTRFVVLQHFRDESLEQSNRATRLPLLLHHLWTLLEQFFRVGKILLRGWSRRTGMLRDSADYANPNTGEPHSGFARFISCMTTGSTALWRTITCEMKPNFLGGPLPLFVTASAGWERRQPLFPQSVWAVQTETPKCRRAYVCDTVVAQFPSDGAWRNR